MTEIADVLSLSDKTVSTYRVRMLQKLTLKTNASLIRYALDDRLIESSPARSLHYSRRFIENLGSRRRVNEAISNEE